MLKQTHYNTCTDRVYFQGLGPINIQHKPRYYGVSDNADLSAHIILIPEPRLNSPLNSCLDLCTCSRLPGDSEREEDEERGRIRGKTLSESDAGSEGGCGRKPWAHSLEPPHLSLLCTHTWHCLLFKNIHVSTTFSTGNAVCSFDFITNTPFAKNLNVPICKTSTNLISLCGWELHIYKSKQKRLSLCVCIRLCYSEFIRPTQTHNHILGVWWSEATKQGVFHLIDTSQDKGWPIKGSHSQWGYTFTCNTPCANVTITGRVVSE